MTHAQILHVDVSTWTLDVSKLDEVQQELLHCQGPRAGAGAGAGTVHVDLDVMRSIGHIILQSEKHVEQYFSFLKKVIDVMYYYANNIWCSATDAIGGARALRST